MIALTFTRTEGHYGKLIRWFTKSEYNHVMITWHDTTYEADMKRGVISPADSASAVRLEHFRIRTNVSGIEIAQAHQWLKAQVGQPYDWLGILGQIVSRPWASTRGWYCSRLATRLLWQLNKDAKTLLPTDHLSPHELYEVVSQSTTLAAYDHHIYK